MVAVADYQDKFRLSLSSSDASRACRDAVAKLGWKMLEERETCLVCQRATNLLHWATKVDIRLAPETSTATRVSLYGSMFGWGKMSEGHLKGEVGVLRGAIEGSAAKMQQHLQPAPLACEQREPSAKVERGAMPTDAEQGKGHMNKPTIKQVIETKCTCNACGNIWYYGKQEISDTKEAQLREAGKGMMCLGGCLPALLIPSKKVVDLDKCPKCGSRAVNKESVTHEV